MEGEGRDSTILAAAPRPLIGWCRTAAIFKPRKMAAAEVSGAVLTGTRLRAAEAGRRAAPSGPPRAPSHRAAPPRHGARAGGPGAEPAAEAGDLSSLHLTTCVAMPEPALVPEQLGRTAGEPGWGVPGSDLSARREGGGQGGAGGRGRAEAACSPLLPPLSPRPPLPIA